MISVQTIPILLSLLIGISAILLLFAFSGDESLEREGGTAIGTGIKRNSIFLRLFGNVIVILGDLISLLPLKRDKLDKLLTKAGRPGNLTVDQFHASRIIGCILALLAGMFIDNELSVSPFFTVLLTLTGFFYPTIWLNGVVQKRVRRIFRDLPDMLDTLRLAVDAGLDLGSALKVVVEKGRKGPLLEELELVEKDIALGRTRKEAFRSFADRIGMIEINSFVLALIQADQLGASVGPVLRVQADVSRGRRWQLAEAIVNKLPMKMLGPLVLFIFPASFIILFTPLMIQWLNS